MLENMSRILLAIDAGLIFASCSGCDLWQQPRALSTAASFQVHNVSATQTPQSFAQLDPSNGATVYLATPPILQTADVSTVDKATDSNGSVSLRVNLTAAGAKKLRAATTPATGQRLALIVNGQLIAMPSVRSTLSDSVELSGVSNGDQVYQSLTGW